jgi:hypothetical protein
MPAQRGLVLAVFGRAPLVHDVDGFALALVVRAHDELAEEPEADEDHPRQEQERAEKEQGPPADRLVGEELEAGEVGKDEEARSPEEQAELPEQVCRRRAGT